MTTAIFVALAVMAVLGLGMLVFTRRRDDQLTEYYNYLERKAAEERQRWHTYLRSGK